MKILLIDDDKKVTQYLFDELKATYNFDVNWIEEASDALDSLKGTQYDAIILDVMMPVPDSWSNDEQRRAESGLSTGTVLFKKIRELYKEVPILIYSAKGGIQTDEFSYYFRKPELTKTIVEQLKKLIKNEK